MKRGLFYGFVGLVLVASSAGGDVPPALDPLPEFMGPALANYQEACRKADEAFRQPVMDAKGVLLKEVNQQFAAAMKDQPPRVDHANALKTYRERLTVEMAELKSGSGFSEHLQECGETPQLWIGTRVDPTGFPALSVEARADTGPLPRFAGLKVCQEACRRADVGFRKALVDAKAALLKEVQKQLDAAKAALGKDPNRLKDVNTLAAWQKRLTGEIAAAGLWTYLADLREHSVNGTGTFRHDGKDWSGKNDLTLNNLANPKGLLTMPSKIAGKPIEVVYHLERGYGQFVAAVSYAGWRLGQTATGQAVFRVYCDGVKVWDSGLKVKLGVVVPVEVDVTGVQELKLTVTAEDQSNTSPEVWGDAQLKR